jgi:ribose 5-phosphate isomerase A
MATPPTTARKASPEQLERLGEHAASFVKTGDRVGLGSGKAALAFVRALGRRVQNERLQIVGIPTSLLTEQVAREVGIPLSTLAEVDGLEIAVDGADEVDPHFNCIKGGGGNLAREKVVESIAERLVLVVGEEKIVEHLGASFPVFIEIIDFSLPVVVRRLHDMGASVVQRKNKDGTPFITDNGNPYLEAHFHAPPSTGGSTLIPDPATLDRHLHTIPGIIDTGLFINMVDEVLIAYADGRIEHRKGPVGKVR